MWGHFEGQSRSDSDSNRHRKLSPWNYLQVDHSGTTRHHYSAHVDLVHFGTPFKMSIRLCRYIWQQHSNQLWRLDRKVKKFVLLCVSWWRAFPIWFLAPFFRYCGNTLPPTMTSTGTTMSVIFQSDASISHEGFVATYLQLDASTMCGGTYYTITGMLESPNFPNGYGHLLDCTWVIQAPPGQHVMLNFTRFNLENHTNCNYDSLEIR